jgi:GTP cyclohydrolase I
MSEYQDAINGLRAVIRYIGDDPDREGLKETPDRVLAAWVNSWGVGYVSEEKIRALTKMFEANSTRHYGQMVIVSNIAVFSHCEHHMTPFYGRADVAYIPGPKGLIGISKMARIVDVYARRLQVQERLTEQVADTICDDVAVDVAVLIRCTHMCMVSRGVHQPNAITTTSALRGAFKDEPDCRAEFLKLVLG